MEESKMSERSERKKERKEKVKLKLVEMLKLENAFWSYDPKAIEADRISDENLIALTFRHLDLEEINLLYTVFSAKKIKDVWKEKLVPEGHYLYTLNRFFAWYYFGAKNPDRYLKYLETRHLNKLLSK